MAGVLTGKAEDEGIVQTTNQMGGGSRGGTHKLKIAGPNPASGTRISKVLDSTERQKCLRSENRYGKGEMNNAHAASMCRVIARPRILHNHTWTKRFREQT